MSSTASGSAARAVKAGTALTDTGGKGDGQGHGGLAGRTALTTGTAAPPARG
ncbi:hypothetical protein [Kitasatospora sp. NPDC059803]|uniref:hypothetical protein n=1 Tax=Kitasatospora sp. NPDC059803 TaxID=3346953 RepID=UPI00364E9B4F